MATKYPKYFFPKPIAETGDKTIPPVTPQEAGEGRLSIEQGWTELNSRPLDEGGIPPDRADFNGLAYTVTQLLCWLQQGGQMKYDATMSYEPLNEVFFLGEKYRCIQACQGIAPTDKHYWKNLDRGSALNGAVMPYYNAKVGGSDGRRLVPWGAEEADESWVLCDGGNDGHGGTVPDLMDRFLMGSTVSTANGKGGSSSVRLNANNLPAHSHSASMGNAGGHNHNRGNMNIWGEFGALNWHFAGPMAGAFYFNGKNGAGDMKRGGGDDWVRGITFDASRHWTGNTSWNGDHTHQISIGTTGNAQSFNITPPFYKLAFFVKVAQ